jgi:hypothetical protein
MLSLMGKEFLNYHQGNKEPEHSTNHSQKGITLEKAHLGELYLNRDHFDYTVDPESVKRVLEVLYPEVHLPAAQPPSGFTEFQRELYRSVAPRHGKHQRDGVDVYISRPRYISDKDKASRQPRKKK